MCALFSKTLLNKHYICYNTTENTTCTKANGIFTLVVRYLEEITISYSIFNDKCKMKIQTDIVQIKIYSKQF